MPAPLEGIKVIEMTRLGPGPFCGMVLGDLGAEVIRVEEPGAASSLVPRTPALLRQAAFNALNRNKRSIILDLKQPAAQAVLQRLAGEADVFTEGFRPGVVKRLGCDYETLHAVNPRLVYCSISGYGQDGPYKEVPGHDLNYIAMAGALSMLAHPGGPPIVPPNVIADFGGGGMYGAVAILAALMGRTRTGQGQYLDIALSDSVLYLMANIATRYFRDGFVPEAGKWDTNGGSPAYNVYQCKDGRYMSICCGEPRFWEALCRTLGREDLISAMKDRTQDEQTYQGIAAGFLQRTRDEWWTVMRPNTALAVAPVFDLQEALEDRHNLDRHMAIEAGTLGREAVRQIGVAPGFSTTPGSVRNLAPVPGQNTDDILQELRYTPAEIDTLRRDRAVS